MPQAHHGTQATEIANGCVRVMADYTGRGPRRTRAVIDREMVMVFFGDMLTKGERKLVESGREAKVLEMRHVFQEAMREELVALVEHVVGRRVVGFMSTNHIDPDIGLEVFVLEEEDDGAVGVAAADAS